MLSKAGCEILKALEASHEQMASCESAAYKALDKGDTSEYMGKMRDKAILLAELYENLKPFFTDNDTPFWERVKKRIADFSRNANLALDLDSVFFMSALLYPEDHIKGELDNLLRLIMEIRKHCSEKQDF